MNTEINGVDITDTQPDKEASLVEWFKSMGYRHEWDGWMEKQQYWHEFFDPENGRLAIQIGFGVTKEEFLKSWDEDENTPAPFFVGGMGDSEEWEHLEENIKKHRDKQRELENET